MAAFSGGAPRASGGNGIFFDEELGEGMAVWIDIDVRGRIPYIQSITAEGGRIASAHWSDDTRVLILSPRSVPIFDMYCHPAWLDLRTRAAYYRRGQAEQEEPWTNKVMLKEAWIGKCLSAGRLLGEADNWAGCRVGGPPVDGELIATTSSKRVPVGHRERVAHRLTPQSFDHDSPQQPDPDQPRSPAPDPPQPPTPEPLTPNPSTPAPPTPDLPESPVLESPHPATTSDMLLDPNDEDLAEPALFAGLRFWLDPEIPNRSELLRELSRGGGKITTDSTQASHVLVADSHTPTHRRKWHQKAKEASKAGAWVVEVNWALECIQEDGRLSEEDFVLPQEQFILPGGSPPDQITTGKRDPEGSTPGGLPGVEAGNVKPTAPQAGRRQRMSTERVAGIFATEAELLSTVSANAAAFALADKYQIYSQRTWHNLLLQYKSRTRRFANYGIDPGRQVAPTSEGGKTQNDPAPLPKSAPQQGSVEAKKDDGRTLTRKQRLEAVPRPKTGVQVALYEAYRYLVERLTKRSNLPVPILQKSQLSRDIWHSEYMKYHDEVVAKQVDDRELKAYLEEASEFGQAKNPNESDLYMTHRLATKVGILDLDGWRNLCARWRDGSWPEAAGNEAFFPVPQAEQPEIERTLTEVDDKSPSPTCKIPTAEAVRIFQHYAPMVQAGMPMTELGKMLQSQHGGHGAVSWAVLFGQWKRQEGQFAPAAGDEAPVKAPTAPAPTAKRSADQALTPSPDLRKRRAVIPYDEAEEREMASYILSRLPDPTRSAGRDWEEFAQNNNRSSAAYAEHYRSYRNRIDDYVREMKASSTRHDVQEARAGSVGSDDSSVVALDPPSEQESIEYVDMTGLDSEDEA